MKFTRLFVNLQHEKEYNATITPMKKIFILMMALVCMEAQGMICTSCSDSQENSTQEPDVAAYEQTLLTEWKDSVRSALGDAYKNKVLSIGAYTMPLYWTVYGERPADGYALFISLHGGGQADSEVNDSQWENQKRLYHPKDAVYLCPRAITNTWDLHFVPEADEFYRNIIMMAEAMLDVNPNKVYVMGYSAGGDGVWRLAPRMADTWAAASMMAGHPGDVGLVNLRNVPFMIWCGELDSAYERNVRCQERIDEMAALHNSDPEGYINEGHIVKGKGHWMDREDSVAVDWMAQYERNPYPKKIVWRQEEVVKPHFYWLSAPANELKRGMEVTAAIEGNTIKIEKCDYTTLTLSLNDKMMNLDQPVTVEYQGKPIFQGKVKRDLSVMRSTLFARNDPAYIFPVQIKVSLHKE